MRFYQILQAWFLFLLLFLGLVLLFALSARADVLPTSHHTSATADQPLYAVTPVYDSIVLKKLASFTAIHGGHSLKLRELSAVPTDSLKLPHLQGIVVGDIKTANAIHDAIPIKREIALPRQALAFVCWQPTNIQTLQEGLKNGSISVTLAEPKNTLMSRVALDYLRKNAYQAKVHFQPSAGFAINEAMQHANVATVVPEDVARNLYINPKNPQHALVIAPPSLYGMSLLITSHADPEQARLFEAAMRA